MFVLEWYAYLIIAAVVTGSMLITSQLITWLDNRKPSEGPCLEHTGTWPDGMESWCMLKHGHTGVHQGSWDAAPNRLSPRDDSAWPVTAAPFGGDAEQNDGLWKS